MPISLAIELLAAAQGIEFLRPLRNSDAPEQAHPLLRAHIPALTQDRFFAPDIEHTSTLVRNGSLWYIFRALPGLPKLWVVG